MDERRDILDDKRRRASELKKGRSIYYWTIRRNRAVGYRMRTDVGKWFAQMRLRNGKVKQKLLGVADDFSRADGKIILTFHQALGLAERWFEENKDIGAPDRRQYEYDNPFPELPNPPPYTVAHACKDYFMWYRSHRRSLDRLFATMNRQILPKLGFLRLDELTPKEIIDWHMAIAESPPVAYSSYLAGVVYGEKPSDPESIRKRKNTANINLAILKAILNRAYVCGFVRSNWAWTGVRPYKNVRHKIKADYLDLESVVRLVNAAEPKAADLIKAGIFTGCRVGDILMMKVSDYLKPNNRIVVFAQKTQHFHHIALSKEASSFFERMTSNRNPDEHMFLDPLGRPWTRYRYRVAFLKAQEIAGFKERISYHTLRHTYASHAAMANLPLKLIANQLGHKSTQMVDRFYAHLSDDFADEEVRSKMPTIFSD